MEKKKYRKSSRICDIIEACAKAKVRSFRYGTLEISFEDIPNQGMIDPRFITQEQKALAQPEADLKEEEISLLHITDPEKFEDMIAEGELMEPVFGSNNAETFD